jgi:hypothetical protein
MDMTAPQPKQSAELLCPFRQPLLTDSHHGGRVVGHLRHALLHHGALWPFVAHLASTATEDTGDVTVHHRAAGATGTGQRHLGRGPLTVQARLVQPVQNLFGAGLRVERLDRLWDADAANAARLERLPQDWVIAPESTGDRRDRQPQRGGEAFESRLDLVN